MNPDEKQETPQQRLIKVLEWLYVDQGTYDTKHEWREELVSQLYFLAGIDYPKDED